MARQLGLLRSIESAGAAADSAKIAAQVASAQQQAGMALETAVANAAATAADQATSAMSSATGSAAGQTLAEATLASGGTTGAAASAISIQGPIADANSLSSVGSGASLAASLGTGAVVNAGLISAEFVPGASSADGEALSPEQLAASVKGTLGSQPAGSVAAEPDVVQGFAQVARAFDQADAIAQARIARVAAQNRSVAAASAAATVAGTAGPVGAVSAAGSVSSVVLDSAPSVALAQVSQALQFVQTSQVGQSSGTVSAAGIAGGIAAGSSLGGPATLSEGQGVDSEFSLAGPTVGSPAVSGMGRLGGGGSNGSGNQSSPRGQGSGGPVVGNGFSAEAGSGAIAQGVVSSTFSSALSAAGGAAGSISVPGLEAGVSPVGSSAATSVGASAAAAAGPAVGEAALSGLPGSGVSSAVTPQTIGGSLRLDASGPATVQSPVTADQLPVALDQTAIDLARLRGGMLTLELAPADLGRLSFEMRIDDSGAAFVAIRLADDTVRALVENAAGALRDSLSREGFKLDSFTVSSGFSSPEQRENSQNQAFAETSNRRVQSSGSVVGSGDSVQSRASNTQVRPGTSSLSLFA
jgi:hypothetical protein